MAIDKVVSASITDSSVTSAKVASGVLQPNFRNIVINGSMDISQRATSASSLTGSGYNTVDRFQTSLTTLGTWTQSQSTTVPSGQGFASSLKMDCTTADASPASGDNLKIRTKFEGQNLQYLKKGTSSAESLTLSFWVRSNKTGTYIVELMDNDNSQRHINKSYTISSADTWEKKEITFAGDTTGALDNDDGAALEMSFYLGAGSGLTSGTLQTSWGAYEATNRAVGQVNLADSTDNEWYITGIQLEVGTAASDFEFLPRDVNLRRCLRYYEELGVASFAQANDSSSYWISFNFRERKRANPSASLLTTSISIAGWGVFTRTTTSATIAASYLTNTDAVYVRVGGFSGNTAGETGTPSQAFAESNGLKPFVAFSSEL
jgi:hypothetical protein